MPKYIVMHRETHAFYRGDSVHVPRIRDAIVYDNLNEIPCFIEENIMTEKIINLNDKNSIKEEIKYIKEILSNGYKKTNKKVLNSNLNQFERILRNNSFLNKFKI